MLQCCYCWLLLVVFVVKCSFLFFSLHVFIVCVVVSVFVCPPHVFVVACVVVDLVCVRLLLFFVSRVC